MVLYDPPSGWMYGFPKVYRPQPGETLAQTLLRDGYPQEEIDNGGSEHCRFIGELAELEALEAQDEKCVSCGHPLKDNSHGFDQNDGHMEGDKLLHSGKCTYCKHC